MQWFGMRLPGRYLVKMHDKGKRWCTVASFDTSVEAWSYYVTKFNELFEHPKVPGLMCRPAVAVFYRGKKLDVPEAVMHKAYSSDDFHPIQRLRQENKTVLKPKLTTRELFDLTAGIGHLTDVEQLNFIQRYTERRIKFLGKDVRKCSVQADEEDAPFQRMDIDFDEGRDLPCPDCGGKVYARWWPQQRTWELTECLKCGAVFYSWWEGTTVRD